MIKDRIENYTRGWIIGDFEPSLFRTKEFEVALISHHKGEHIPLHYHAKAIEYNVLVLGKMLVNGEEINPGDVFVFEKNEVADVKVLEESKVMCIKTPSVIGDKICIK